MDMEACKSHDSVPSISLTYSLKIRTLLKQIIKGHFRKPSRVLMTSSILQKVKRNSKELQFKVDFNLLQVKVRLWILSDVPVMLFSWSKTAFMWPMQVTPDQL